MLLGIVRVDGGAPLGWAAALALAGLGALLWRGRRALARDAHGDPR
ncbi:hypothetical protein BST28156_04725 [Burkholderia stagnalis]|nr:hypothetical protein BST28156_04725 [Burkholderia stagnalis]